MQDAGDEGASFFYEFGKIKRDLALWKRRKGNIDVGIDPLMVQDISVRKKSVFVSPM